MSIKSLMITSVESQYTQEYIANVFWNQNIATVSSVTLIPYMKNHKMYSLAYVSLSEWHDNEATYNFINRLKNRYIETRIIHHNDEWWSIQINTHNAGIVNVDDWTLEFDSSYFQRSEVAPCSEADETSTYCEDETGTYCEDETGTCCEDETSSSCEDDDVWSEVMIKRPIKGLAADYYTVEEAENHVWMLNKKLDNSLATLQSLRLMNIRNMEDEIDHFDNELRIHSTVNKSRNVTLRPNQIAEKKYEDWRREASCSCDLENI